MAKDKSVNEFKCWICDKAFTLGTEVVELSLRTLGLRARRIVHICLDCFFSWNK